MYLSISKFSNVYNQGLPDLIQGLQRSGFVAQIYQEYSRIINDIFQRAMTQGLTWFQPYLAGITRVTY